jgi:hypothetical protein
VETIDDRASGDDVGRDVPDWKSANAIAMTTIAATVATTPRIIWEAVRWEAGQFDS